MTQIFMAAKTDKTCPVIWLLTDNKPGHRNQLKGLGNRLRVLAGAALHWIDVSAVSVPLWRVLLGRPPVLGPGLPRPDLIIAAGSSTHRLLLALRNLKGARKLVLMKPNFPLRWIDGAIIPQHDKVKPGLGVFLSQGVINAITPLHELAKQQRGLILLGGPSAHFRWSDAAVTAQIEELLHAYPQWSWCISSSRRTPVSCQQAVTALETNRIQVVTPQNTDEHWLSAALANSRAVWITPDSMSMVCEALTSGVPTGVFQLSPKSDKSRVVKGLAQLQSQHLISAWDDQYKVMTASAEPSGLFWQADAAARWVIKYYLPGEAKS